MFVFSVLYTEMEDMKTQLTKQRVQSADVRKKNQRLKMEFKTERQRHKNTQEESE